MPWLFERHFGIRAFDYWWGYTTAQIELLVMDQPVIEHITKENKRGKGNSRADVKEMDALSDAWNKKKEAEGGMESKTFSLSGFLKGEI